MDYLLTKQTVIEFTILASLYYFFNLTFWIILTLIVVYNLYSRSLKKHSNLLNGKRTMKAALYSYSKGGFEVRDIPIPAFGKNELLIEVKGASINPIDYKIRSNEFIFIRWLNWPTVGRDFCGTIIDKGEDVKDFKIGDDVYGNAVGGSLQQFTVVLPNQVGYKPKNISYSEAASIALAGGTSLQALNHFGKVDNKIVLIIGGSGGTGNLGVQIAKYFNATVYAVCSGKNAEFVKSLGADFILDYNTPNYLSAIENVKFDVVYDTVSSSEDGDLTLVYGKYLKQGTGRYVAINGNKKDFFISILSTKLKINLEKENYHITLLDWNTKDLNKLKGMVEENRLKSKTINHKLTTEDVLTAFSMLQQRRTVGKIVIDI